MGLLNEIFSEVLVGKNGKRGEVLFEQGEIDQPDRAQRTVRTRRSPQDQVERLYGTPNSDYGRRSDEIANLRQQIASEESMRQGGFDRSDGGRAQLGARLEELQGWEDAGLPEPEEYPAAPKSKSMSMGELRELGVYAAGSGPAPVDYGGARAPRGGVTIGGKFYRGGQYIPGEVMSKASPEERQAVESGESKQKPLPPQRGIVAPSNPQGPKPPSNPLSSDYLFSPEERALPKNRNSAYHDPEGLWASATANKPTFDVILNTGQGVSQVLGGIGVHPKSEEEFNAALNTPGPVVIVGGLKGMKRAAEKVAADFQGDWSRLHDVVRGTIVVDAVDDIPKAIHALRSELEKKGWKIAKQPKNRFETPTDAGYRDLNLSVVTPDGLIGEVQINTKAMMKVKEMAHKLYEVQRTIEARAAIEKRDMTPEETAEHQRVAGLMREIYGKAWNESTLPQSV